MREMLYFKTATSSVISLAPLLVLDLRTGDVLVPFVPYTHRRFAILVSHKLSADNLNRCCQLTSIARPPLMIE